MGNEAVFISLCEMLQELWDRREKCLRDYDRLYAAVFRLRTAVRTAEAQHETAVLAERRQKLYEMETRLASLEKACIDLDTDWRVLRAQIRE